ncbi:hypothetical protein PG988_002083 [Apiospora saccharicola]
MWDCCTHLAEFKVAGLPNIKRSHAPQPTESCLLHQLPPTNTLLLRLATHRLDIYLIHFNAVQLESATAGPYTARYPSQFLPQYVKSVGPAAAASAGRCPKLRTDEVQVKGGSCSQVPTHGFEILLADAVVVDQEQGAQVRPGTCHRRDDRSKVVRPHADLDTLELSAGEHGEQKGIHMD